LTAPVPRGQHAKQRSPVALKNALVHAYLDHRCLSRTTGPQLARSQIRKLHLTGWRVRISTPFTSQRTCTSYAFDEQTKLVLVVPMPPR
jgi:hypothetical protein